MSQTIPKNRTVFVESAIHIIECASCSIDFGIGDDFMARRRKDHATFYCPNGHSNVYSGDNTEEKLRKDLVRAQNAAKAARDLAEFEAERRRTAEYQRRAAKGQLTKTRKRIANGVCPCCNRTFQDLSRHMAGQHPEFVEGSES